MKLYYNENDPFCVEWLKNLMINGLIPRGVIDNRDIKEVRPKDIKEFDQCHFFAGIGGWAIALKDFDFSNTHKKVWTGSVPCQPFSVMSSNFKNIEERKRDERNLWPYFFQLIQKRRPAIVFGEQVAGKFGLDWFENVRNEMENATYKVAAADLCASSIGAPHIRQRIYWGAISFSDALSFEFKRRIQKYWSKRTFDELLCKALETSLPSGKNGLLVDGVRFRSFKIRAYGNAIIPKLGSIFIKSFLEAHNKSIEE